MPRRAMQKDGREVPMGSMRPPGRRLNARSDPRGPKTTSSRPRRANPTSIPACAKSGASIYPRRSCFRHYDNWLRGMPCRSATAVIVSVEAKLSRAIRIFSSALQERRVLRFLRLRPTAAAPSAAAAPPRASTPASRSWFRIGQPSYKKGSHPISAPSGKEGGVGVPLTGMMAIRSDRDPLNLNLDSSVELGRQMRCGSADSIRASRRDVLHKQAGYKAANCEPETPNRPCHREASIQIKMRKRLHIMVDALHCARLSRESRGAMGCVIGWQMALYVH